MLPCIGCSLTDLAPTDTVRQCADRGFATTLPIPSGVVCYNRTTAGSEAVYICDDGFHQNGALTRVCQSGGVWNGSLPQCLPSLGGYKGIHTYSNTSTRDLIYDNLMSGPNLLQGNTYVGPMEYNTEVCRMFD